MVDCEESQCGGKVCGRDGGTDLFCIRKECTVKEEDAEDEGPVCGNNICEAGEENSCSLDCTTCVEHESIDCHGKVIFKGTDEFGCPLEPICIKEVEICEVDEDCGKTLCGNVGCVNNTCEVGNLLLKNLYEFHNHSGFPFGHWSEKISQCIEPEDISVLLLFGFSSTIHGVSLLIKLNLGK